MRISVISDDLTGASDCGGQLVQYGLDVSVVLQKYHEKVQENQAVIFNTDSRALAENEAYKRVKKVAKWVQKQPFDIVYKKIDSTMRGNVGQEINAVADVFRPDFVLISPAFPKAGRQVVDGIHFLHQKELHETEVANDPKTPVRESEIAHLIEQQAKRKVGHLFYKDLRIGSENVCKKLAQFKEQGISYITVDAIEERDLNSLVTAVAQTDLSVVWVGSTGLINYLPPLYGLQKKREQLQLTYNENSVLFVVGSVSKVGRNQLHTLQARTNTVGLEINPKNILETKEGLRKEIHRILTEAGEAFKCGKNVALFSSAKVKETQEMGRKYGYSAVRLSNEISAMLGDVSRKLIEVYDLKNLFLTGGDTAQQVLERLNANSFQLIDEVEAGIPLGKLDNQEIFAVTKAGSFGTELAMVKSLYKLQGKKSDRLDILNHKTV
ncbi:four-carbon acid sugar kinase family protein [Priestia endophytica]|uniref:four-carbon acid sugar kinase family protein n=1 Tax=Priestia endophytica TaxID=135735 RepID=UPI003D26F175